MVEIVEIVEIVREIPPIFETKSLTNLSKGINVTVLLQ